MAKLAFNNTIPGHFLLYVCSFICISLVVLRRGDSAWREVFTVPQSTQGCLIGWSQQGGGVVSQSAHARDWLLCNWIWDRFNWYCRACCSWGETQETSGIKSNPDLSVYVCFNVFQHNFRQLLKRHLPSTDCGACIEAKPFCKANNEVELTGFYGNRPLIRSWRMVSSSEQRRLVYMPAILTTAETSDAFQDH